MSLKVKIAKITGIRQSSIPSSYQIVGHVMLIKFMKIRVLKQKQAVAFAILSLLPHIKTVCEIKEVKGEFREPSVSVLAGNGTLTIHKENEINYKIDAAKVMFSKGNLFERKRLLKHVKEGETIIDMFAGIGYFSLPIAKLTHAKEIISIEKNPMAYNFLTENIALNKINNVIAIQGDCIIAAHSMREKADRIIMGYFPGTEKFLPAAVWMAKPNCTVHFHNIYREKEIWKTPIDEIRTICEKFGRGCEIISRKRVKSFSPRTYHVVIDFMVT